jgi:hypothetical protein
MRCIRDMMRMKRGDGSMDAFVWVWVRSWVGWITEQIIIWNNCAE